MLYKNALLHRRALLAGSVGNFIEWFEFGIYGFLVTIFATNFFRIESSSALAGLILAYASLALAFFFRPLGAFVFGRVGDRFGRRPTLITVIVIMTMSTVAIGLIPTYATIGIAAPLILTFLRVLQGFSAAGEVGGAISLMTEFAPMGRRGFYGAWQSFTVALGMLTAALFVAILDVLLGSVSMQEWGWRVPFLSVLPMGLVALWLRLYVQETPSFVHAKLDNKVASDGFSDVFKNIAMGTARVMGWSAAGYTFLVVMPTYLEVVLDNSFQTSILIAVLGNLGFLVSILPSGVLSDKIGRKKIMMFGIVLILLITFPLLRILQSETAPFGFKCLTVMISGFAVGIIAGPGPAMLAEMFSTRSRYTGIGLSYAFSNSIFAGAAGLTITYFIDLTGNKDIPAYYVFATATVSLLALITLPVDRHRADLEGPRRDVRGDHKEMSYETIENR